MKITIKSKVIKEEDSRRVEEYSSQTVDVVGGRTEGAVGSSGIKIDGDISDGGQARHTAVMFRTQLMWSNS